MSRTSRTCTLVCPRSEWGECSERREEAQKAAADAAAHVLTAQQAINAVRKEEAEKETAKDAELRRLVDLELEANQTEREQRRAAYRTKKEKEEAAAKEFRKERRALNAKLARNAAEEAKQKKEKERKERERIAAIRAAAIDAKHKPEKKHYFPHLDALIKHFEEPLPKCAAEVLKHSKEGLLTDEQKKALRIARQNQIARDAREFWNLL